MAGRAPKRDASRRRDEAPTPRSNGTRRSSRAATARFAIVAARFNEDISKRLVDGALGAFEGANIAREQVDVHWVPGSFELPLAAAHLAAGGRYAAIVCVGVVIRGQTPHYDYVAREAAAGIRHVAATTGIPTTFGVITALSEEQAWARAGGEVGNRGEEAADAAIEMVDFIQRVNPQGALPGQGSRGRRVGRR